MERLADLSDEELASRAATGERDHLEVLLGRHFNAIHGICHRVLSNNEDALDATQEALIAISRSISRFDGKARFTTWMYRVATNAAIDEARKRNRRPVPVDELPVISNKDPVDGLANQIIVDAALGQLPPEYRAAVVLRDLIGCDYAEIAEILEIPPGTVRSRIARGRAALADLLDETTTIPRDVKNVAARGNQTAPAARQTR